MASMLAGLINGQTNTFFEKQRRNMKVIHCLSIGSLIIALALFVFGFSKIAGLVFGFATMAEILGSALVGKQTNDGEV